MGYKIKVSETELKKYLQNHTIKESAEYFGVCYGYVSQLITKYGIKSKRTKYRDFKLSDEQIQDLIEYSKNHNLTDCSFKFQITIYSIIRYEKFFNFKCLRYCGKTIPQSITKQSCKRTGEAQEMIRYLSTRFTNASIGRVFGYSTERIRQICMENKEE